MADNTKKYELVKSESIVYNGKTLYRIRALRDFITVSGRTIKKGDLGGYVESEDNLSQEGNCWIFDNAKVYGNAKVFDDAIVNDSACIFDSAVVCGEAEIFGNVEVSGTAIVFGVAKIGNNQKIKAGEFMYDAVDITTLLPKVQAMHKQVLRMCAGKYLIDENYLDNIIKEFNEYDKARKVKEELYHVALPLKTGEVCALLEEISNALEKIKKSKRFNKEVDNQ